MNPTAQETNAADARIQAVGFGEVTCLGTLDHSFPIQSGNCFSVIAADGRSFKIVNFVYENMVEALRRGTSDDRWAPGVAWPVRCVEIGPRHAVVHDPRIPTSWYQNEWCECCCPFALLPTPQRLRTMLRRESGEETVATLDGITVVSSATGQRVRLPGEPPPEERRPMMATWGLGDISKEEVQATMARTGLSSYDARALISGMRRDDAGKP